MNAVEFLTNHRVVVNRHARGAPLPHLTDKAVQSTLDDLKRSVAYNTIQWRGRGGGLPTSSAVEFDRQLDKISIWIEGWSHQQTCRFLEELLRHSSYTQIQLLHTILQPSLHRDFMYTVRSRFPEIEFSPVSTHVTRELKEKLARLRLDTFHRVRSAHVQKDDDVEPIKLPLLLQDTSRTNMSEPHPNISSWTSLDRLNCQREIQTQREAKAKAVDSWIDDGTEKGEETSVSQDAVARFMEMPVRRHIQDEQMNSDRYKGKRYSLAFGRLFKGNSSTRQPAESSAGSRYDKGHKLRWDIREKTNAQKHVERSPRETDTGRFGETNVTSGEALPKEAKQVMLWYTQLWNGKELDVCGKLTTAIDRPISSVIGNTKKSEFLHKLLLKLDPRQHYFTSSFLSLKAHKDIVGLLPEKLAIKILEYLTPKELLVACKVSRKWEYLANSNSLWKLKCKEVKLEVPIPTKPDWKNVFKDNLYLRLNWNKGLCRTVDFRGHMQSVLCVTCDNDRMASGSADKTIKVWDIRTGALQHTLRGHTKGVWCLQFFTKHLLVSGSYDSTIRVWNLRTGTNTRTLLGHGGQIWCLKRFGPWIVSGSQDRTAKVWDIGRSLLVHSLYGHNAAVFSVDIAEEGNIIITGSADRSVRLWQSDTGQLIKVVWVSPTTSIMSVSYSRGFFACSYDGTVCFYRGGKLIRTFNEHRKRVESVNLRMVDVDKNEGYIISAGKDGLIKYWDINKKDSAQTFTGHNQPVNCVYVDQLRIASASYDNKIKVWDFNIGMPCIEDDEEEEVVEDTDSDERPES